MCSKPHSSHESDAVRGGGFWSNQNPFAKFCLRSRLYRDWNKSPPGGLVVKNQPAKEETWFSRWVGKILQRTKWQPSPVFLPGRSHDQRNLAVCSPWGHKWVRHDLVTKQQREESSDLSKGGERGGKEMRYNQVNRKLSKLQLLILWAFLFPHQNQKFQANILSYIIILLL